MSSVRNQRGTLVLELAFAVVMTGLVLSGVYYGYRIVEHETNVWGTFSGFARLYEAERSYRRAGFTGDIDFQTMQILMPGVQVHSSTSASNNPMGYPYELRSDTDGEQVYTTYVDTEAQASQIAEKLAGKGSYVAEGAGFRVTYRPIRTDSIEDIIKRSIMFASGPIQNKLKDRLNFGPEAIRREGAICRPPGGPWTGGITIDNQGRIMTCVRVSSNPLIPERRWRVATSSQTIVQPPAQVTCGDGTVVSDRSTDCKDCPNGSNIRVGAICPPDITCGDGTKVTDRSTDCKDCPGGSNIDINKTCPVNPVCDDGTQVSALSDCKTCRNGKTVGPGLVCPKNEYCDDDTTPVESKAHDCKICPYDQKHIYRYNQCDLPPTNEQCGDGTKVNNAATECKDCPGLGYSIPIDRDCDTYTPKPQCGDGTFVDDANDCQDCWDGSNIPDDQSCPVQPQCDDGTLVTDESTECKTCSDGREIGKDKYCDACGDGTKVNDVATECKTCWKDTIHKDSSCWFDDLNNPLDPTTARSMQTFTCGSKLIRNDQTCHACDIGGESTDPCNQCVNETIHPDQTCPTCGDGTIVDDKATDCQICDSKNIDGDKTCHNCDIGGESTEACNQCVNKTIHPDQTCPTCSDGTKVDDKTTDCKDCTKAGTNIPVGQNCPMCKDDKAEVKNPATDCKICGDGRQILKSSSCGACGDGTEVSDPKTDCKNCWDESNIPKTESCPVQPQCGDGTKVVDKTTECKDCWDKSNIHMDKACPIQPECGDGTKVTDRAAECKECWDGSNIHIDASCPIQPRCGDGTLVTDKAKECKDCDSKNIHVDKTCYECDDGRQSTEPCKTCRNNTIHPTKTCPTCDDGEVVDNVLSQCKPCDGSTILKTKRCYVCSGDGKQSQQPCKDCWNKTFHPSAVCPTCGDGKVVDFKSLDCIECEGSNVRKDTTCYTCTIDQLTSRTPCKTCWKETIIRHAPCPTCPDDGKVVDFVSANCKTCWDETVVRSDTACPPKPELCGNNSLADAVAPDCCDAYCNFTPTRYEYKDKIVYDCPDKPIHRLPPHLESDPRFTIVRVEHRCNFEDVRICTDPIGPAACYGPSNYCDSPKQVWYGEYCVSETSGRCGNRTGFVCETTF